MSVEFSRGSAEAHYRGQVRDDADGARRSEAVRRFFREGGFPTGADEEWRFSDLDILGRTAFSPSGSSAEPRDPPEWTRGFERRVLLWEGARCHTGPIPPAKGLRLDAVRRLPDEPADADGLDPNPLDALNIGLFDCGFLVSVEAGCNAGPVLLHSMRPGGRGERPRMLQPRSLVELGPGSRATVFEVHASTDGSRGAVRWTNPSTICRVGRDAELRYLRVELEGKNTIHTARTTFRLGANARVSSTVLSLGRGQSRDDTAALFESEGAEVDLAGLFLGLGTGKADHHTLVVHRARHCSSRQLYKNVLAGRSRAVFDGRVVVAPGAIGTDARQTNRNLLLSGGARAHAQPRLEINADDVKCAHGAAIGRLDEEALFYLRSRGLGRLDAREMLVRAFAGEVIERVPVSAARGLAEDALARLRGSGGFPE